MFPYKRMYTLFASIDEQSYSSKETLAATFNVSERTIRSDVLIMNDILSEHGIEICYKRKQGYYIKVQDHERYLAFKLKDIKTNSSLDLDTSNERINHLLLTLINAKQPKTMEALCDVLCISKATLSSYLKTIRTMLQQHGLSLSNTPNIGIQVFGDESSKRLCLLDHVIEHDFQTYLTGFSKQELQLFQGIDLYKLQDCVVNQLQSFQIQTSDFDRKNLILHFALMISRIQQGFQLTSYATSITSQDETQRCLNHIFLDIEYYFDVAIHPAEKKDMYLHFVSNTKQPSTLHADGYVFTYVSTLLDNIHQTYNFDLRKDHILVQDLRLHFKSILHFKALSLHKRNPLLNTIKKQFPLPYEITLTAISQTFQQSDYQFSEDDIGYISLHIGAAIERCFSGVIQRKNVILLCGSGQATTRMLEARMNIFFKDKINIIKKVSYLEFLNLKEHTLRSVDFVVSTIPVKEKTLPVIVVDFALPTKDIESISKFLVADQKDSIKKIDKFFEPDLFIKGHFTSKQHLLNEMYTLLENKGYVDQHFYESVKKREEIASTYMSELFALPHPMQLCAKQTKVVVAILDQPIVWNHNQQVRIVLLLAIKQDEHLDIEHLYDVFINIMNHPRLQQELLQVKHLEDFLMQCSIK